MFGTQRTRLIAVSMASIALVLALSVATACRRVAQASPAAAGEKSVTTRAVAIPVDGMICQVCAGTVKSALKHIDGVTEAEINLEKRNAVIHYDERKTSLDALTRAIKNAGYKPGAPSSVQ